MDLIFKIDGQVHYFGINGTLSSEDVLVLRTGLLRFFESNPKFTVLDFSRAENLADRAALTKVLSELNALTQSKNIYFLTAFTAEEALHAKSNVVQLELHEKIDILSRTLELREKMKADESRLREENRELRENLSGLKKAEPTIEIGKTASALNPLLEKLWSEK